MDRLIPYRLGMVRVLQLYVLALAVALAVALGVAARAGYAQSPRRDLARVAASDRGPLPRSGRTGPAAAADSATRDSIGRVLRPNQELVSLELPRPMALLAGLPRGAKVVDPSCDKIFINP